MSTQVVARKDLADAGRSRTLWAVTAVVVLLTGGIAALIATTQREEPARQILSFTFQLSVGTLPIVGLVLGKGAITAERESGSLRMLLSLPPSRGSVLAGKFLGRSVLMLAATAVGVGVTVAALVGFGIGGELSLFVSFATALATMGVAFVAVGVAISASVETETRATALAVTVFMIAVVLWNVVMQAIRFIAVELGLLSETAETAPLWLRVLQTLPPNEAANGVFNALSQGTALAPDPFASAWFPALLLLAWIVLPLAVGYLRFRDADLG
ncbi:ABC transporter permease subunit [Halobaculum sp. MBLA0147]|uniref:ABC transporter permease subunit n=1 Tax=Halobaculum sp. MBLA0147 TaxID=3079934 RepID=UPI003524AA9E